MNVTFLLYSHIGSFDKEIKVIYPVGALVPRLGEMLVSPDPHEPQFENTYKIYRILHNPMNPGEVEIKARHSYD